MQRNNSQKYTMVEGIGEIKMEFVRFTVKRAEAKGTGSSKAVDSIFRLSLRVQFFTEVYQSTMFRNFTANHPCFKQ